VYMARSTKSTSRLSMRLAVGRPFRGARRRFITAIKGLPAFPRLRAVGPVGRVRVRTGVV
jgi:hypothetical protein